MERQGIKASVSKSIHTDYAFYQLLLDEMQKFLSIAIEGMPPKRQKIFHMSRNEVLSNKQIAQEMNISEKTVENQIGRAIKYLRSYMSYAYTLILIVVVF